MVHSRVKENIATRFTLDNSYIERKTACNILGVWLGKDPSLWERNRMPMMTILTKLKFAVLSRKKLINIYIAFLWGPPPSIFLVVWHENLSQAQAKAIERLQIEVLKIILGRGSPNWEDGHLDYVEVLNICQLDPLFLTKSCLTLILGKSV